ncbi:MAG: hypothetical protein U0401_31510 [Anaerolineae bacterium]
MTDYPLLTALRQIDAGLFTRLHTEITEERLYTYLQPLADTLAPSQTVKYTRAPVLRQLLQRHGLLDRNNVHFETDFQHTGNTALLLGRDARRKQIWLLAHLDIISYLIEPGDEGRYPLTPLCYHLMQPGRRTAVALGYNFKTRSFEVAARGDIVSEADETVFFEPYEPVSLHPGQRVCFYSQLEWERNSGRLWGSLDDAGAVAALVLAATVLADYDLELMLGLTDEEEGIAGYSNQTICRGGARLLRYFDQPELVIASDIHEAAPMREGTGPADFKPGQGASFAEKGSRGRGGITPPHLHELQRQLAAELATQQIRLRENSGGYVSRTECVNAMMRTPNVAILGFLGKNRHFDQGITEANIKDLVDLSRAIVCYVLLTQTSLWREVMAL